MSEVETKETKKVTMRDCVCFLLGVVVGIVITFALTTSAIKSAVDNANIVAQETQVESSTNN